MNGLSERQSNIINVFNGKNGPVIAGIVGITFLVALDEIMNNSYRVSYSKTNGFTFEPHVNRSESASEREIDEIEE